MRMKSAIGMTLLWASLCLLGACAPHPLFPPETMTGVDREFDFSRWRLQSSAQTNRTVELGGRIVQADATDHGVVIIAAQLPIVEHPAYGPRESGKRNGEFVILYAGKIPSKSLQQGHRLIVVGRTAPPKLIPVDEVTRSFPAVDGHCLHIWNTGGRDIADFPSYGAGYEPLEEDTFCVSAP